MHRLPLMPLHPEPTRQGFRPCGVKVALLLAAVTLGIAAEPQALVGPEKTPPPVAEKMPATKVPLPVAAAAAKGRGAGAEALADIARLHQVQVTIPRAEWDVLERDTYVVRGGAIMIDSLEDDITRADGRIVHVGGGFGGNFPWVHTDMTVAGKTIKDVAFRYKGNGSYSPDAGMHRSIKVKTELFGGKGDWDGLQTINFNSGGRDPSRTREAMVFAIFRMAGVPASRTAYAEVRYTVPGLYDDAYGGLFTVIENVNKGFLKQALPPGTGLLMKPERMNGGVTYLGEDWANYTGIYRPEREATDVEAKRVIEFARLVNRAPVEEFRTKIESYLDVDEFMRFLAVHALIHGSDSFLRGSHNFFIYLDPKDNRFRFIPWDEDGAMGNGGGGRGGFSNTGMYGIDLMAPWSSSNPLSSRLLSDPQSAARYQEVVRDIVAKAFNREALIPLVDKLEALVNLPLILEDNAMTSRSEFEGRGGGGGGFGGGGFGGGSIYPRDFLESRFRSVQQQMAGWGGKR